MVNILKVYYKNEIRRVAIASYVVEHYNKLCCKIVELFPVLSGKTFILGWKDGDGDDIVMSSDPELAQAVACANDEGGVMKIYVHQTEEENNSAATSAEPNTMSSRPNHINVICDGCGGEVNGYRYKCLQCKDYDLCHACNARDVHLNHDMLKMALPYYEKRKWCFLGYRRLWGNMFNFVPDIAKAACGDMKRHCRLFPNAPIVSPECVGNHAEKGQDFLKAVGDSVAHLLDAFGVDVEVSVKPPCDEEKKHEPSSADCNLNKMPSNSTEKHATATKKKIEGATGESTAPDKPNATDVTDAEKNAVKTAKDVYMEFLAKQEGDDDAKTDSEKEKGARPKSPPTSKIYPDIPVQNGSHEISADTLRKHADILKEHVEKVATLFQKQGPADMLDLFKKQAEKFISTVQHTPKSGSPSPNDDWTMLNPEPADENTIPKAAAATPVEAEPCRSDLPVGNKIEAENSEAPTDDTTPSAPKENDARTDQEVLDPAIASALQSMLSMGYNNEGGWLIRLLKTKHGNINETLDSLYQ